MKRIYLILAIVGLAFSSCETDFEVNAEWKEVTVVYGLLDKSADEQFIKINKAYLGDGNALQMAGIADSVNFLPEDLLVKIYRIKYGDTLQSIVLDTTLVAKDDGLFSTENNIIYTFNSSELVLNKDSRYALSIENLKTGNLVTSNTDLITKFDFVNFNPSYKFGFYNPAQSDSAKYLSKRLEWSKSEFGQIYQLDVRFNYLENGAVKSLLWSQPLEKFDGRNMALRLEGDELFTFLRNNLVDDGSKVRQFLNIDLVMTIGTEDLETYINVNKPIQGIVQERPQFSNINNGIGLYSSRFTHEEVGIGFTDDTRNYLVDKLGRNFQ